MLRILWLFALAGCVGVPIHGKTNKKPLAPDFKGAIPYEWVEVPTEREDTTLRGIWAPTDGPPVLLLYGSNMGIAGVRQFIEMLHDGGYSVLCCDYRGTGFSSGRWWTSRHLDDDARALWRWMRQKKAGPGGVVGLSIGSIAAARLLAEESDPPAAVVLDRPVDPRTVIRRYIGSELGGIGSAVSRLVARPKCDVDMAKMLAGARTDALVVLPEYDMYCPPGDAAEMTAKRAGRVTVVTVPGGHLSSHLVRPRVWRSAVLDFLDARLRPGRPPLGGRDVAPDVAEVVRASLDGRDLEVVLDRDELPERVTLLFMGRKGNVLIREENPRRRMKWRIPRKYAKRLDGLLGARAVAESFQPTTGTRWAFGDPADVMARNRAARAGGDWSPWASPPKEE